MMDAYGLLAFFQVVSGLLIFIGFIALALYIIEAVALHRLAQNRGIENAWLAWIPVGRGYLLGAIGDHIEYRNGKTSYYRYILLGSSLASIMLSGFTFSSLAPMMMLGNEPHLSGMFGMLGVATIGSLAGLVYTILSYVVLYQIYKCYRPDNAVLWTILGIFFQFLQPFFLLTIRNAPPIGEMGNHPPYGPYQQPPYQQPPYDYDPNFYDENNNK